MLMKNLFGKLGEILKDKRSEFSFEVSQKEKDAVMIEQAQTEGHANMNIL